MARKYLLGIIFIAFILSAKAQKQYDLDSGWKCINSGSVKAGGEIISSTSFPINKWLPATVPGTVLTTLINNKSMPDPFYGMNNEQIPDIYTTGSAYYTYWFVKNFVEKTPTGNHQLWLHLRGVNYSCEVYLNGHRLNKNTHHGMFLRQCYNITNFISKDGQNRLAVIVYPPDPVGNPNGGQGGDGEIARNVSHQFVAGWDWIQPVRDRNTGIWDKVSIEETGPVNISNPHIVTKVPGIRLPEDPVQPDAVIKLGVELENPTPIAVVGILKYVLKGETISAAVNVAAHSTLQFQLPDHILKNPELWWPNGYGPQHLYHIELIFEDEHETVVDKEPLDFGVREISTSWNSTAGGRQTWVNGQPIFLKGGNWIVSDALLRFSPERYDAELRFHRDMNLNLVRVWGGALTERPEFYEACDKYGLLVFQDFWNSGDCNGRWTDPKKKEDQWTRRHYPDDHALFLESAIDQVKMIRNHPSLAFWCGGNEITPPDDILSSLKDSILPSLDGTRYFYDYSNSDSMSFNFLGGNGDGPYQIQHINTFWNERSFPFNSEVGSVGLGDYESLKRFLPAENLSIPPYPGQPDAVWSYHKYIGYDASIYAYGKVKDLEDFADKAQLVNYDQYRALMEGVSAHMWEWYTGSIIWKTQNPWTAMRGQMYDCYLDVNACLYGLRHGSEPLHVMFDPVNNMVMIVNNTFNFHRNMMLEVGVFDMKGTKKILTKVYEEIGPSAVRKYIDIGKQLDPLRKEAGLFLSLKLLSDSNHSVSENLYWLPDSSGRYSGLQQMVTAPLNIKAFQQQPGKIAVTLTNPAGSPVAFFNRLSLINAETKKRILPVFYSDNYVSVEPGSAKTIILDYKPGLSKGSPLVSVKGWNVNETIVAVK